MFGARLLHKNGTSLRRTLVRFNLYAANKRMHNKQFQYI